MDTRAGNETSNFAKHRFQLYCTLHLVPYCPTPVSGYALISRYLFVLLRASAPRVSAEISSVSQFAGLTFSD